MTQVVEAGTPVNLTASGVVCSTAGNLIGFYVNSTSSGTIVIRDGASGSSTVVSGTITPAVGFHRFPAGFGSGCYATLGGTINVTFFFKP